MRPPARAGGAAEEERGAVIPAATSIRVRLAEAIDTKRNHAGDAFQATLEAPILVGARIVVPKGTAFAGRVVAARSSGMFRGQPVLALQLNSFRLNGKRYLIDARSTSRDGAKAYRVSLFGKRNVRLPEKSRLAFALHQPVHLGG
ncbi:MAG: hypothetical protein KGN36_02675 [Acidobacteriota bacterium]|nr:hypothetical protein [Acidobacteriota bacterium]